MGVGASPQSGVFGQGQKRVGDQHEASHLEEETRAQPQCHKPGSRKSSQHLEWISGDTGGPHWHAAPPLYFSLQIENKVYVFQLQVYFFRIYFSSTEFTLNEASVSELKH